MSYILAYLIIILGAAVSLGIYRIQAEADDDPFTRQQRALRRHHREEARERKARLRGQRREAAKPQV